MRAHPRGQRLDQTYDFRRLGRVGPLAALGGHVSTASMNELHKLHDGEMYRGGTGAARLRSLLMLLRWRLCLGAPGSGGADPGPNGVGRAGAPRTQWRATPRCRPRARRSAGWRGPPPTRSAAAPADQRWAGE